MYDELAEQALLGACLLSAKAPLIAGEYVTMSDFYLPKHQLIFGAIVDIVCRGADPDPVSVASSLGDKADRAYIFSLPQLCPSISNTREYAQAVREASLDRRVREAVDQATGNTQGKALLSSLQESLYGLDEDVQHSVTMSDVWQRMAANINVPLAPGCEYPWRKVQWLTRGMRPGWLCVLAGEPSHGKTAGALAIAEAALKSGKRVVLLSLEMDEEATAIRLAMRQGMDSDRYYDCAMQPSDADVIRAQVDAPYWRNLHLERVESASQIGLLYRRWKPDLLIVDHLQLLAGSEDVRELSKTTRHLKLTAERFEKPLLCLSQLSRVHGDDANRPPKLTRLRGSGTIEQDADTVVFVWRKRDENEVLTSEASIITAKSRMGRTGALRCSFNEVRQEFVPVTNDYA